jgi:hypothetical protein
MHLNCPYCDATKNIGDIGRFYIFKCDNCHKRFRGIHADINWNRHIFSCLNPFSVDTFHAYNMDCCPYCGLMISMGVPIHIKGYKAPENCVHCLRRLPTWLAKQDSNDPLDD